MYLPVEELDPFPHFIEKETVKIERITKLLTTFRTNDLHFQGQDNWSGR